MSRRKPQPGKNGLDALKPLRGHLANKPAPAQHANVREKPADKTSTTAPDDLDLFRREMRDVAPIDDGGRAELERTRPAPTPLPHTTEPEPKAKPRAPINTAPADDATLFRHSMTGVTPLASDNRVDLSSRHARSAGHKRHTPVDPHAKPDPERFQPLMPTNPDGMSEAELFRHAINGTQPLDNSNRIEPERPLPPPEPKMHAEDESAALRESMEMPITLEDRLEMGDETAFLRTGLPRKALTDLRRGRWTLQGELDLHGFTREEAREALAHFLSTSLKRGSRCVRVIHGKGLGSPGRVSILKQLSRGWLAQREEILAFCQASPAQGGSGALMVLLRGAKKQTPPR